MACPPLRAKISLAVSDHATAVRRMGQVGIDSFKFPKSVCPFSTFAVEGPLSEAKRKRHSKEYHHVHRALVVNPATSSSLTCQQASWVPSLHVVGLCCRPWTIASPLIWWGFYPLSGWNLENIYIISEARPLRLFFLFTVPHDFSLFVHISGCVM